MSASKDGKISKSTDLLNIKNVCSRFVLSAHRLHSCREQDLARETHQAMNGIALNIPCQWLAWYTPNIERLALIFKH